jgi:hypothetical protein
LSQNHSRFVNAAREEELVALLTAKGMALLTMFTKKKKLG